MNRQNSNNPRSKNPNSHDDCADPKEGCEIVTKNDDYSKVSWREDYSKRCTKCKKLCSCKNSKDKNKKPLGTGNSSLENNNESGVSCKVKNQ